MEKSLPAIPAKRYFTIGEVSELCGVKPYVLRYWEQEFTQLKPMKRRGNRRYYQHHEVLLIRRIRELLYDQGFTISGARNRLADAALAPRGGGAVPMGNGKALGAALPASQAWDSAVPDEAEAADEPIGDLADATPAAAAMPSDIPVPEVLEIDLLGMRRELLAIRKLLSD
jgi:DNA-binding transcriptional MerR regulator